MGDGEGVGGRKQERIKSKARNGRTKYSAVRLSRSVRGKTCDWPMAGAGGPVVVVRPAGESRRNSGPTRTCGEGPKK